jgi:hypothetical protein
MASTISAGTTSGTAINISGDTSGALQLQTNNGTTAVTIDTSQNVGIGTTSPSSSQVGPTLQIGSASGANNQGNLRIAHNNVSLSNSRAFDIYVNDNDDLTFKDGTSNSVLMTLTHSSVGGNLLVGTTTAGLYNQNSVNGISVVPGTSSAIQIATDPAGSSGNASLFLNMRNSPVNGAKYTRFFYNGSSEVGSISLNGTTGVLYNLTSDYRLKNNATPLTGASEFIMALQPKTWDWWDGSGKGVGFIAHEFMEVAKYSGNGKKDEVDAEGKPVYQTIQPSSSEVMANLVALVQELNAKVEAQAATITALQAKVGV